MASDIIQLHRELVEALRDAAAALRAHGDRSRKLAVALDSLGNSTEAGTATAEAIADMVSQTERLTEELPGLQRATGRVANAVDAVGKRARGEV